LSLNKKVTKEVSLGGGVELIAPAIKATLPLRTLSRRALGKYLTRRKIVMVYPYSTELQSKEGRRVKE